VLWDVLQRRAVRELQLKSECVALVFSADGETLATTGRDDSNEIVLWRVADGQRVRSVAAPSRSNTQWNGFALSPDFRLAAHTMPDFKLRLVDLGSGRELWTATATTGELTTIAFSPDGRLLATGAGFEETPIRLWDVATGREVGRLEGHTGFVSHLAFSRDGRTLFSASGDQTLRAWDVAARKPLRSFRGHKLEVWCFTLLPDGRTLVSGAKDGTVQVWSDDPQRLSGEPMQVSVDNLAWRFVDGETCVVVGLSGRLVRVSGRHFEEQSVLLELGAIASAVIDPKLPLIAVTGADNAVRVWNWETKTLLRQFPPLPGPEVIDPDRFLAEGKKLIVGTGPSDARSVHEWEIATGAELRRTQLAPHQWPTRITFKPDEREVVVFHPEGDHRRVDLVTWREMPLALNIRENIRGVFSPDGRLLVAATTLGYARVWATDSWHEVATLSGFMLAVTGVQFSNDGRRIVTTGWTNEAALVWDVASFDLMLTLRVPKGALSRANFSPDDNVLGAVDAQSVLHFWRAPSWEEIAAAERVAPNR
jgi:WD40 repeat protein